MLEENAIIEQDISENAEGKSNNCVEQLNLDLISE